MDPIPFLEDIYPQNLLYAVTIRSGSAKGHIKLIQFPKLPDNYTIITARNIPGENKLIDTNMPILADSCVNYIGEPAAILLGPDKIKLESLAAECIVLVDEQPAVFNYKRASLDGLIRASETGNTDKEFENDNLIVTSSYSTGIQDHWYAEPTGAVSWYSETKSKSKRKKQSSASQSIIVKTATQWPAHVRRCVAHTLAVDPSNINVEQTALSLHMDGKLWYPSLIACHAALGTFITKKPVRLILNREEDFFYSPKRAASSIDIISTVDKNGKITAAKADIFVNLGAYEVNGDEILDEIAIGATGYYKIDNFKLAARANFTNLPPQGPFSGFGLSQGFFAIERHVSLIADTAGIDPALWRRDNIEPVAIIDKAAAISDYYRKWSAYELLRQSHKGKLLEKNESPRGIGIAVGFQGSGLIHNPPDSIYTVEVTLTKDNKLEIKTNIASSEDYSRIWEKTADKIISIEPGKIKIITHEAPDCGPSCSSRNITIVTKLFEKCCQSIKKQKSKSSLPITVRRSCKPDNSFLAKPGRACAVVEVSVDLVECSPKIRGVWLAVDGGKIISKNRAKRALVRGAVQALGWAFTENIEYTNGALTKNQYDNFSIPGPVEIPPIHIDFLETEKSAAGETKGIGELPFTCIPAAFLQAVSMAMDYAFKKIPLKRNEIWEMVKTRGKV